MAGLEPTIPPGAKMDAANLYLARKDQVLAAPRFVGRQVHADGGRFEFANAVFRAAGGFRLLNIGELAPARVTVAHGWFDGAGVVHKGAPSIRVSPGSSLSLQSTRFDNFPGTGIAALGDALRVEECWFGACGLGSVKGDHLEWIFVHRGEATITQTVFDLHGSAGRIMGSWTGVLFFSGREGPIKARVEGCRLDGVKANGMVYPVQVTGPHSVELTILNSAIQRGTSGKYIGVTPGKSPLRIIDGGGNTDLDTGRHIDVGRAA